MLLLNLSVLATGVALVSANLLNPLPRRAASLDLKFQPVMDFDKDGCYNVAAVDSNGNLNQGLDPGTTVTSKCRSEAHLHHSNAYSRHMCNRGWCAIIYAYYFEMDDCYGCGWSHRHDFEHVAVWLKDGNVRSVCTSSHGGFEIHDVGKVRFQGNHPKIVYHRGGARTHTMRLATKEDDKIENHLGVWFDSPLVDWSGFPSYFVRETLVNASFGSAHMEFKDGNIGGLLAKSMPEAARRDHFDCAYDDGTHSW